MARVAKEVKQTERKSFRCNFIVSTEFKKRVQKLLSLKTATEDERVGISSPLQLAGSYPQFPLLFYPHSGYSAMQTRSSG